MATLQPPSENKFSENSIEKKIYNLIDSYQAYIPIQNDRYRLSYYLYKFLNNEGEPPLKSIEYSKIKIINIDKKSLALQIEKELESINIYK